MIKKLILLACFAALVLVGQNVIKRYPETDKTVTSMTRKVRRQCKSGWKSTQRFYRKNINRRNMDKTLTSVKAPFKKFMKDKAGKSAAPKRNDTFTIVHENIQPPTVATNQN